MRRLDFGKWLSLLAKKPVDVAQVAFMHDPPAYTFCTGCGETGGAFVVRSFSSLCQACHDRLVEILQVIQRATERYGPHCRESRGPNFMAVYFSGRNTIGVGLYLASTPGEAMAEAIRVSCRTRWKLLRVDIQRTLTDIYRSADYRDHFRVEDNGLLLYDAATYGPVPELWT